jgi:hypothetical protein
METKIKMAILLIIPILISPTIVYGTNGPSNTIAPWYNMEHTPVDCQVKDPMCCALLSCPLNQDKYVGGFRELVGNWYIINITAHGTDRNTTGTTTFMGNGTLKLMFPTVREISADGEMSNTVTGMWASDGKTLVIYWPDALNWVRITFTEKSPQHMELVDTHNDTIHLRRQ